MIHLRHECVICKKNNFTEILTHKKYPIISHNTDSPAPDDVFYDMHVVACTACGCSQLKYTVDSELIYNNNYRSAGYSSVIKKHDESFSNFIHNNTTESSFLEVGSNNGNIYKLLSAQRQIEYTVVDMFRGAELSDEVIFIQGNCEEIDLSNYNTVILSHVFEHLIDPDLFLNRLVSKTLFVSIPNFDYEMETGYVNILNTQHTFYCGYNHIIYLMARHGYQCEKFDTFINFASMFKFVKRSGEIIQISPEYSINRIRALYSIYSNKIEINEPCFVYPTGYPGQYIYYHATNVQNIIGFLDGDSKKTGTRLYGTELICFYPDKLLDYIGNPVDVIVCQSYFQSEILQKLELYKHCIKKLIVIK